MMLQCNDTCCTTSTNITFCFADRNFTEKYNLTHPDDWEIALRYTISIPLALMGFVGNFLTIFLLLKNNLLMRTSVNIFILNMAIADLIHSLSGPIPYTIKELSQFWILGRVWCYAETYIEVLVMLVSMTSIAIISFDRMLGIVRPFHRYLKQWQSLIITSIIWIYAAALSTPFAINKIYMERQWKDILETSCAAVDENLHIWWDVVNIGSFWILLTIMVICYSIIFFNFKKYTRIKQEHPASLHMKRRVLHMLLSLTLLVIFLWLPIQVFEIVNWYLLDDGSCYKDQYTKKVYKIMMTVSQYLMYVVPAVNPIVYALMHQNFKRAYRTTFTCCFKEKPKFFLVSGEGSRPFMWSLRSSFSAFASSVRRKSISMRGQLDTHLQSLTIQSRSYGNSLTVPGQDPHLDKKDNNIAKSTVSEPVYPQKINNDENKSILNGHDHNGNGHDGMTGDIPLEPIFLQNNSGVSG